MNKEINSLEDLKNLTKEEINTFFSNTEFTGTFTKEIKSKHTSRFCGSMNNIRMNNRRNHLCPGYINVPSHFNLAEGSYRFKLMINDSFFENHNPYFPSIVYESITIINKDIDQNTKINLLGLSIEERTRDLHLRWGVDSNDIIAYYREDGDESYVENIRKLNFAQLGFYPGDERKRPIVLKMPFKIRGIQSNQFYQFKWKLADSYDTSPFQIHIDFSTQPKQIDPESFINTLFDDRHNDTSRNFGSTTNFLDTLSKQLTAREETFVYELLQNANDYPQKNKKVNVEFHITDNYLLFMHSGEYFNVSNISGICGINEKDKISNKEAIGYKGIGFKTVFLNNRYVYIKTGNYSFRFDENADKIKRIEAPWPILPVWTKEEELSNEIKTVFNATNKKHRVQMALRPDSPAILHSSKNNYKEALFNLFSDSNIILFTPNINSVTIKVNGETIRHVSKDNNNWILSSYTNPIDDDTQESINKKIESGKSKIPEKYVDFSQTTISFACKKEEAKILQVEGANIYCYLPTSATWGFPFLINTDMIPKGDRDDIEMDVEIDDDTNFNILLAGIAGQKFYQWIYDLIQSGKYDYDSIFSLIPDFEYCIETNSRYEDFIKEFQAGFESQLIEKNLPFIPIKTNDKIEYKPVSEIIYDKTEISTFDILTDEKILDFANWKDYFAHPELRNGKWFNKFIDRYHSSNQVFDIDELLSFCNNHEFNSWLENQNNNNLFLTFLVDREYIDDFYQNDKKIYLDSKYELYKADDLYDNIDDFLFDLEGFLDDFLPYLSKETRKYFKENSKWIEQTAEIFKTFDAQEFVDSLFYSYNRGNFNEIISEKENSIRFIHFLAENDISSDEIFDITFLNADEENVSDFDRIVFFNSENGHDVKYMPWMDPDWIEFVSDDYFIRDKEKVKSYFSKHLGVKEYSDNEVIDKIILDDEYDVNYRLDEWEANLSFLKFVYKNAELFEDAQLSNFQLLTANKDGEDDYYLTEDNIYFFTKEYESLESEIWVDSEWIRSLSEDYLKGFSDTEKQSLKQFLKKSFGVQDINVVKFSNDIILSNLDTLSSTLEDNEANISFWRWIKENYRNDLNELNSLPFIIIDSYDDETFYSGNDVSIYISDSYMPESKGIESIVKKYNNDAYFISSAYLEDKKVGSQKAWKEFLEALEIKVDISDLIYQLISEGQLGDIEDEHLPGIITEVKDLLFEEKNVTLNNLKNLRVITKSGQFRPIHECLFIDSRKGEIEPFKEILIENECSLESYSGRDIKNLILEIAEAADCIIINNITDWRIQKLSEYIKNQEDEDVALELHFKIIEELLNIEENERDSLKSHIKEIKLLSIDDEYKQSNELTFGTRYKPLCDFEANGIDNDMLDYISNKYLDLQCDDFIPKLIRKAFSNNIHYNFVKEDIILLENYDFAMYFWKEYLFKPNIRIYSIKTLIEEKEFSNKVCVPVQNGIVKKAEELYYRKIIKDYVANKIEDWQDKIPNEEIPISEQDDLLNLLNFKKQLNFEDGITALLNIGDKAKRNFILRWMQESFDENDNGSIELVKAYKDSEKATWRNRRGKFTHIKELYALSVDDEKTNYLEQYFKLHPLVIESDYFPLTNPLFTSICNMMDIPIIEWKDMEFKPEESFPTDIKNEIKRLLLLVAAIEEPQRWDEYFSELTERLDIASFYRCKSISLAYSQNEEINQNASKFYFEPEYNSFYYVNDWRSRTVYLDFVRKLQDLVESELANDIFNQIFDLEVDEYHDFIEDYCTDLADDIKFKEKINEFFGVEIISHIEDEEDVDDGVIYHGPRTIQRSVTVTMSGVDEGEDEGEDEINSDSHKQPDIDYESNQPEDTSDQTYSENEYEKPDGQPQSYNHSSHDRNDSSESNGRTTSSRPYIPGINKSRAHNPKNFRNREFSVGNSTPLSLSTSEASDEEMMFLSKLLGDAYNIDRIIDENYLVRLRFYNSLMEEGYEHNIDVKEFILDNSDSDIYLNSGKYIHKCSAQRGTLYISPSIWRKLKDDECIVCMFYGKRANEFIYVRSQDELMQMIDQDAILIQVTGNDKKEIVDRVYDKSLDTMSGQVYTLIRTIKVDNDINPFNENPSESFSENVNMDNF